MHCVLSTQQMRLTAVFVLVTLQWALMPVIAT